MKKTLWLFGDSFTAGHWGEDLFFTQGVTYKWDDSVYKRRSFAEDLKNLLNCDNVVNLARGGGSNFTILSKLIEHLSEIQPNDIVVIGTSTDTRYTYCASLSKDKMEPLNWGVRHDLQLFVEGKEESIPKWVSEVFSHLTKEQLNEIISFYTNHNVHENSHIVLHNKLVKSRIVDLCKTINTRLGGKAYIWGDELWEYPSNKSKEFSRDNNWGSHTVFETVYTWTNKVSHDGHWSPNGYLLAAYFLSYCVKSDIHTITVQDLASWYVEQGSELKRSLEYIPFTP